MEARRFPDTLLRAVTAGRPGWPAARRWWSCPGAAACSAGSGSASSPWCSPTSGGGERLRAPDPSPEWDLVAVGNHDETKRPELLVELARRGRT